MTTSLLTGTIVMSGTKLDESCDFSTALRSHLFQRSALGSVEVLNDTPSVHHDQAVAEVGGLLHGVVTMSVTRLAYNGRSSLSSDVLHQCAED